MKDNYWSIPLPTEIKIYKAWVKWLAISLLVSVYHMGIFQIGAWCNYTPTYERGFSDGELRAYLVQETRESTYNYKVGLDDSKEFNARYCERCGTNLGLGQDINKFVIAIEGIKSPKDFLVWCPRCTKKCFPEQRDADNLAYEWRNDHYYCVLTYLTSKQKEMIIHGYDYDSVDGEKRRKLEDVKFKIITSDCDDPHAVKCSGCERDFRRCNLAYCQMNKDNEFGESHGIGHKFLCQKCFKSWFPDTTKVSPFSDGTYYRFSWDVLSKKQRQLMLDKEN